MQTLLTTMNNALLGRTCYPTSPPPNNPWQYTIQVNPNPGCGDGGQDTNAGHGQGGRDTPNDPLFDPDSRHYCHSHGITQTPNHTSFNCHPHKPNYQSTETFDNKMNGSTKRCHLVAKIRRNEKLGIVVIPLIHLH